MRTATTRTDRSRASIEPRPIALVTDDTRRSHPLAVLDLRGQLGRALPVFVAYLALSSVVFGIWADQARTEQYEPRDAAEQNFRSWKSVVEIESGRAPAPFVHRRLLVDAAAAISGVVPASTWDSLERYAGSDSGSGRALGWVFQRHDWKPGYYALLSAAYLLIWASILGFMYVCRRLAEISFMAPPWMTALLGAALGVALLGGLGDYNSYPYDLPNAFVFGLTLIGMLQRRWWTIPLFAVTAYSKETAVLLVIAYWLLARHRRSVRFWMELAALAVVFAAVRAWIQLNFPATLPPEHDFWYPVRNVELLALSAMYWMWLIPVFGFAAWRMSQAWPQLHPTLRRLSLLIVMLAGLALFKGWIEERRQYLEVLPLAGLLLAQWIACELGVGHLLTPRSLPMQNED